MKFFGQVTAAAIFAISLQAANITVYPGSSWTEQSTAGCPCNSSINGNMPRNGTGSLEIVGPRSRFALGDVTSFTTNLGLLSNLTAFSYDFLTSNLGSAPPNSYPIARLHLYDPINMYGSELVWENAETGNVAFSTGTWQSYNVFASGSIYRFVNFYIGPPPSGFGIRRTFNGPGPADAQTVQSIAAWSANTTSPLFNEFANGGLNQFGFSAQTYVVGVSLGIGGGATNYLGYADNVTLAFGNNSDTFNFEAIPEPSTYALMALGLGLMAARIRKRR